MSLIDQLSKELEKSPEKAKKLARKLIECIEPELSVSFQIGRLAERMERLAEEQTKIWKEIKELKEEQTKIWQEIKEIKQEIKELKEEQTKLREDFNRMLEEIQGIKVRQDRFERELTRVRESLLYGFSQLSKFAGVTFEQFVRMLLTDLFRKFGEIPEGAELTSKVLDGEEIDIFLEDPLIVGEVTAYAEPDELDKLLRKARKVEEMYRRKAKLILIVETADEKTARKLRKRAREEGVDLIIGREL